VDGAHHYTPRTAALIRATTPRPRRAASAWRNSAAACAACCAWARASVNRPRSAVIRGSVACYACSPAAAHLLAGQMGAADRDGGDDAKPDRTPTDNGGEETAQAHCQPASGVAYPCRRHNKHNGNGTQDGCGNRPEHNDVSVGAELLKNRQRGGAVDDPERARQQADQITQEDQRPAGAVIE
jgi:hypothetical protein